MRRSLSAGAAGVFLCASLFAQSALAYRADDFVQDKVSRRALYAQFSSQQSSLSSSSSSFAFPTIRENVPPPPAASKISQLDCMQQAVAKRENAIRLMFEAYYKYVNNFLVKRSQNIEAAMKITDTVQRRNALTTAWKDFGFTWREAGTHLRDLRRNAWMQFRAERYMCGQIVDEEGGGLGFDSQM